MTRKMMLLMLAVAVCGALVASYCLAQPERREEGPRPERAEMDRPAPVRPAVEQAEHLGRMLEMINQLEHICFDPAKVSLLAIGGLKDDVHRKPAEVIKDFEEQLQKAKTLGVRNAIRLTLKDLYKAQGEDEKLLQNARDMLAENDAELQKPQAR